jgi:hypothetical protein
MLGRTNDAAVVVAAAGGGSGAVRVPVHHGGRGKGLLLLAAGVWLL